MKNTVKFLVKSFWHLIAAICLVSLIAVGTNARAFTPDGSTKNNSTEMLEDITDANIGAIVSVADGLDIDYGKIALSKSKNKMVLEFAQRMVTDHTAVQGAAAKLLEKLGVTPEDNETSRSLGENGVKVKEKLNSLSNTEFDKFYIDNEVSYHELVVNATEKVLIPNAKNAELKSTLVSVLPLFKRHFEHAQMVQKSFSGGAMMNDGNGGGITDANIGAIVLVADDLDIAYGQIALSKSKNKKVREFAQRMVTDHTAVQKGVKDLAAKLKLVPEENETSQGLAKSGVDVKAKLNSLKGKELDKYYIDNEVAYHQLVVNATESILIPGATNPELKAALEQALPLFKRHLEHAQLVQASFGGKKVKSMDSMNH